MAHIQESNRFRETTLRAMCELVQNMHKKYHDWTACEEDFLSKYGAAKCLVHFPFLFV